MDPEQAQQMIALQQSMYNESIDLTATTHTALAYAQYQATIIEIGILVVLVGLIIICCMLRPSEKYEGE